MARRAAKASPEPGEGAGPRGVALGFLAMAPLLAAYEVGVSAGGPGGPRNFAEQLAGRIPSLVVEHETAVRVGLLAVLAVAAFARARLAGLGVWRHLVRMPLEGALFAIVLGPLLVATLALFQLGAADVGLSERLPDAGVSFARAMRALGAGAWEELVFRVGAYSACFVAVRAVVDSLRAPREWSLGLADGLAAVGSSLLFAFCHLDRAMSLVGLAGEAYDSRVFLWRVLAGLFLAGLYRWRGPGVAAWCHGLFNLALLLGAGPGVFR